MFISRLIIIQLDSTWYVNIITLLCGKFIIKDNDEKILTKVYSFYISYLGIIIFVKCNNIYFLENNIVLPVQYYVKRQ